MLEDNVASSDESEDSRNNDDKNKNQFKSLIRHVKQNLKIVFIAYNQNVEFEI